MRYFKPSHRTTPRFLFALLALVAGLLPAGGAAAPTGGPVRLVRDINHGSLFFVVQADTSKQLWSSDGTAAGTALVKDIPLNTGLASARAVTLTATLDPLLTYVDDDSGVAPTVTGSTLTWRLPGAGFLDGRDIRLRVRLLDTPLGTRYPIALLLSTAEADAHTTDNTATVDVMVADLHFLPMVIR